MTTLRLRTHLFVAALLLEAGERLAVLAATVDRGSIWFPPERSPSRTTEGSAAGERSYDRSVAGPLSRSTQIPVELLLQLSNVRNVTDFMNNYVDTNSFSDHISADSIENRFGSPDERKSSQSAKPALCEPQLEVVPLALSRDPSLFYYPTCTRIERCGGCCGSSLLKCQPTDTEIVNFKVIVTQYTGAKQMKFKGNEVIPIERHIECKCDCIIQESDCTKFQEYRKNECLCVCINTDEQQKCLAQRDVKVWDTSTCTCICRDKKNCFSGYYFDEDSCRCTQIPKLQKRN